MDLFEALALATLQALTEFLPVSSSGHLLVASELLALEVHGAERQALFVLLHLASLLALALGLVWPRRPAAGPPPERVPLLAVLVACLPAGAVGLALKFGGAAGLFDHAPIAGAGWLLTAVLLWLPRRRRAPARPLAPGGRLALWPLLFVGALQALAILPGVSRSGATIAAALLAGFAPATAFRLSFLAALPLIAGAQVLELRAAGALLDRLPGGTVALAFVLCFGLSLAAFEALRRVVAAGRLHVFAPYCALAGGLTLVFLA